MPFILLLKYNDGWRHEKGCFIMTLVPSFLMWFWVRHTIYIGVFLIQDKVIIKVVVITKVAVIEKGDIVVAFIYISFLMKILSRTAHR
jgi:hypothetical protein